MNEERSLEQALLRAIGVVIGLGLRTIWRYKATVAAVLALSLLAYNAPKLALVLLVIVAIATIVSLTIPQYGWFNKALWFEFRRTAKRFRDKSAAKRANSFLMFNKLLPEPADGKTYKAYLYDPQSDTPHLACNINDLPQITPVGLAEFCEQHKEAFGAVRTSMKSDPQGNCVVTFYRQDPLDEAVEVTSVDDVEVDLDEFSFSPCVDEYGQKQALKFKDVSGVLVGGQAGSGKTASLLSGLLPYLVKGKQADKVELFACIDGKSSADWLFLEPLATKGVVIEQHSEIQFLTDVRDTFAALNVQMKERYEQMRAEGIRNLWHTDAKHIVLIADEAQAFLEKPTSKEAQALVSEIEALASSLLKRGRAAKITCIFITQKTDSVAIPTKIRDQFVVRIGFAVANRQNSEVLFGALEEGQLYPHQIGRKQGVAVIKVDGEGTQRVRFGYAREATLQRMVDEAVRADA